MTTPENAEQYINRRIAIAVKTARTNAKKMHADGDVQGGCLLLLRSMKNIERWATGVHPAIKSKYPDWVVLA